jgi:hypothetical protein
MHSESDLQLLKHSVNEYKVPVGLRFSLLNKVTLCKSLFTPRHPVAIHLYLSLAFTVLVQAIPEDIRILVILALRALYQNRSR